MSILDLLQWPAMLATIGAAWLVASARPRRRHGGFWLFLASNALWIAWGWPAHAYGLIALQVFLVGTNVRGLHETWPSGWKDHSFVGDAAQAGVQTPRGSSVAAQAQRAEVAEPTIGTALGDRQTMVGLPDRDQPIPLTESEVGDNAQSEGRSCGP